MGILGRAQAACWLLVATAAAAQTAKPDAEAAAAMERAKRQAAGPMRIILEASKARRKGGDPESPVVAEPVVKGAVVRAPIAGAVAPADVRLLLTTASNGESVRAAARSATPAEPLVVAQPIAAQPIVSQPSIAQADPPETPPPPTPTLSSEVLQSKEAGAAVAPLQASSRTPLTPAPLAAPAALPFTAVLPPAASTAPATSVKPRMLSMVEPELSQRVLDQLGRNATVLIDLTIRANGSVAQVTVLPPASRQLERALAPTLEQWKFEPLPAERVHRIELVFNAER